MREVFGITYLKISVNTNVRVSRHENEKQIADVTINVSPVSVNPNVYSVAEHGKSTHTHTTGPRLTIYLFTRDSARLINPTNSQPTFI